MEQSHVRTELLPFTALKTLGNRGLHCYTFCSTANILMCFWRSLSRRLSLYFLHSKTFIRAWKIRLHGRRRRLRRL